MNINDLKSKLLKTAIGKNIIANCTKVFIIFIGQILLVPLYLVYWGTDKYSDWIILSAITAFFNMSDMGLNSVTNNQFCIRYAENKKKECQTLLINNYIMLWGIAGIVILMLLGYCFVFDVTKSLGLITLSRSEASYIVVALVLKIFLDMSCFIPDAIYNANSLASKGTHINNVLRLSVCLLILICILCGCGIVEIVTIIYIPTIIVTVYKYYDTKKLFELGKIKYFDYKLLKTIIKPSLSYMAFPCGFAMLYQGFTIVVSMFYGAETLVSFNTTRTMVNFVRNMIETVTTGVRPEFSLAFGKKDIKRMKMIYRKSMYATLGIAISSCLTLLIGGKWIYEFWTKGRIEYNLNLMCIFCVITLFYTFWSTNSIVLLATNKHIKLGRIYLLGAISSLICVYWVSSVKIIELTALSLIIADIFVCLYSYRSAKNIIKSIDNENN